MQTFVPFPNTWHTARCLDDKRLGKRINWDTAIVALTLIRFGQELGTGGRLAPLVAEAIDAALRLIGGLR